MDLVPEVKVIVHREGEAVEEGASAPAEASAQPAQAQTEETAPAAEAAEA
jgi:hypothetical protein